MQLRSLFPWLIGIAAWANDAKAMESPLPFYYQGNKASFVPTCHPLEFLTREFLPDLADWRIKDNSIESHSLVELPVASDRRVFDIAFELADTFIDKMRITVVGVGPRNFCPVFLWIYSSGDFTKLETIAVDMDGATIVAIEQIDSGRARHWDVFYWMFAEDGSVTEWDPQPAISAAVSGLAPEGCHGSPENAFDLRSLHWRKVFWCGEDRFNVESTGTLEVDFRFDDQDLVPTRRVYVPHRSDHGS